MRQPLGGRPPQENAKDETHIACVLAGQPDFIGLRACVRANANHCAQRDTVAHRYPYANKHLHADQYACTHIEAYCYIIGGFYTFTCTSKSTNFQ
jgi:hypothetical protein